MSSMEAPLVQYTASRLATPSAIFEFGEVPLVPPVPDVPDTPLSPDIVKLTITLPLEELSICAHVPLLATQLTLSTRKNGVVPATDIKEFTL